MKKYLQAGLLTSYERLLASRYRELHLRNMKRIYIYMLTQTCTDLFRRYERVLRWDSNIMTWGRWLILRKIVLPTEYCLDRLAFFRWLREYFRHLNQSTVQNIIGFFAGATILSESDICRTKTYANTNHSLTSGCCDVRLIIINQMTQAFSRHTNSVGTLLIRR